MEDNVVCGKIGDAVGEHPLRVDWHSLLGAMASHFDYDDVEFDSFAELKACVLIGLEAQIDLLSVVGEQIRTANRFEELDTGWWSPLVEQIEAAAGE